MLIPPLCPHCPQRPPLWKDMTTFGGPAADIRWRWFCAGCRRGWEPTAEHRKRLAHAVAKGERYALR
ncbi:hypothetical protein ACIBCM_14795 [Streptomyces sp. NPDC051018]|uniref:hypothetical protein n=1 Tax=Streptomyces sp. NPDC051018 TaxID=3365639 RepID=UPI00379DB15B